MSEVETNHEILPIIKQEVVYCGVCTMPPEYCEFGSTLNKCKTWLFSNNNELFKKYYGEEEAPVAEEPSKDKPVHKSTPSKAEREALKKETARVVITRFTRNKRKHITSISGLELFDVDLKKAAKVFANKFACGASVTKTIIGNDEIVVQGDCSDELLDLIPATWKQVDEDRIDLIEEAKKGKK